MNDYKPSDKQCFCCRNYMRCMSKNDLEMFFVCSKEHCSGYCCVTVCKKCGKDITLYNNGYTGCISCGYNNFLVYCVQCKKYYIGDKHEVIELHKNGCNMVYYESMRSDNGVVSFDNSPFAFGTVYGFTQLNPKDRTIVDIVLAYITHQNKLLMEQIRELKEQIGTLCVDMKELKDQIDFCPGNTESQHAAQRFEDNLKSLNK